MNTGSTPEAYWIHGLSIRSNVALAGMTAPISTPDVTVEKPRVATVETEHPSGDLLLDIDLPWRFSVTRRTDRSVAVLYSSHLMFDVHVGNPTTISVTAARDPDLEYAPLLLQGAVLAVLATLGGRLALHATAVGIDGKGIALVGPSGLGKTTVAALACAGGGRLISDDVVIPKFDRGPVPVVYPGLLELRLRAAAEPISSELPTASTRPTVDGRLAVRLTSSGPEPVPLHLMCVPIPDRGATVPKLESLGPVDAFDVLRSNLRHVGWRDHDTLAHEFGQLAELTNRVPTMALRVPWASTWTTRTVRQTAGQIVQLLAAAVASG